MKLQPYIPLLKQMTEVAFNFGRKTGELCQDTSVFEEIFQSLNDGTIDPGDSEDATNRLMQFLRSLPEYADLINFYRENRAQITAMNAELANVGEDEYIHYTEAVQRISIEMAVGQVFNVLRQQGIVTDKR